MINFTKSLKYIAVLGMLTFGVFNPLSLAGGTDSVIYLIAPYASNPMVINFLKAISKGQSNASSLLPGKLKFLAPMVNNKAIANKILAELGHPTAQMEADTNKLSRAMGKLRGYIIPGRNIVMQWKYHPETIIELTKEHIKRGIYLPDSIYMIHFRMSFLKIPEDDQSLSDIKQDAPEIQELLKWIGIDSIYGPMIDMAMALNLPGLENLQAKYQIVKPFLVNLKQAYNMNVQDFSAVTDRQELINKIHNQVTLNLSGTSFQKDVYLEYLKLRYQFCLKLAAKSAITAAGALGLSPTLTSTQPAAQSTAQAQVIDPFATATTTAQPAAQSTAQAQIDPFATATATTTATAQPAAQSTAQAQVIDPFATATTTATAQPAAQAQIDPFATATATTTATAQPAAQSTAQAQVNPFATANAQAQVIANSWTGVFNTVKNNLPSQVAQVAQGDQLNKALEKWNNFSEAFKKKLQPGQVPQTFD